ncbi:TolC family protein [Maricaulis parjimensis]|uniref:TolC family protein n=1 Tax=Maricaulis parjimensis TaxID=144023 RepID=UPI00193985F6|nr:TolC family protein [Maricaulis parjimensis]
MLKTLPAACVALTLGVAGSEVLAQSGPHCLALDDAMGLAAARAPEVAGAQARLAEAEAEAVAARSLRRPQVSTFGRSSVGDTGLTTSQIENQLGLQVSQRLYDFGDARLAIAAAQNQVEQRGHEISAQQAASAQMLADAYLTRLETLAVIDVVSERRDYFARQRDAVAALLTQGGATRADRAQIEAQLANAEADALELEFLADQAATRIREYAGEPVGELCGHEGAANDLSSRLTGLETLDALVQSALSDNPLISARTSAIRALEARLDRARRNRLPVIEAVGIASYVYDDQREDWEGRDRLGVDVSVPLYSGRALSAERDQAAAQLAFEQSALRTLQRETREEAEIAFRRAISLEAQLVRREIVADSQAEYFEAITGEFQYGLGTLPDLVDARLAYERAQIDVISARFDWLRQKLELLRLTGRMPTSATAD